MILCKTRAKASVEGNPKNVLRGERPLVQVQLQNARADLPHCMDFVFPSSDQPLDFQNLSAKCL